jgi:uncharacterized membrane protein YqjE
VGTRVEPSFGQLVASASKDLSALVHGEMELAKAELRTDVVAAARGGVMFLVAAVFGLFLLVMLCIAFAEGLVAAGIFRWAAYLIVAGVLLVLAGLVGLIGLRSVKKIKPPERTIETTKETVAWAKNPRQAQPKVTPPGATSAAVEPGRGRRRS